MCSLFLYTYRLSYILNMRHCCLCFVSYERLEIPLYIQTVDRISMPCLQSLVRLPDILCQEEVDLYHSAKEACCSNLAAMIHNGSGGFI